MKLAGTIQRLSIAAAIQGISHGAPDLAFREDLSATAETPKEIKNSPQSWWTSPETPRKVAVRVSNPEATFKIVLGGKRKWDARAERRFEALAVKDASGEISATEMREFIGLQHLRRKMVSPPTAAEILATYQRDEKVKRLAEEVRKHVTVISLSTYRSEGIAT